jgi:hypothetical protein
MNTLNTTRNLLAGAAIAGMLGGSAIRLHASTPSSASGTSVSSSAGLLADDSDAGKHGCASKNSCKGQGGCKSSDNGCKGKNSCKGKGGCATDGSKS